MDSRDTEYYDYHLPSDRIATKPKLNRADSKMMYVTIVKDKLEKISELKKFLKLLLSLKNED